MTLISGVGFFFSYGVKFLDQKEIAVKLKNVLNQFHCK